MDKMPMYKEVLITMFTASKNFILLAVVIQLATFGYFILWSETDVSAYAMTSTITYWVLVVAVASSGSDQKHNRLFAQLPITATEVFLASWFFILAWLGVHVLFWMLFGFTMDPDFTFETAAVVASAAISVIFIMTVISIAIDLGPFKPFQVRWWYIASVLSLLLIVINNDSILDKIANEDGNLPMLSITFSGELGISTLVSILICAALIFAQYLIFVRWDSYLK